MIKEHNIEDDFIKKLTDLKYIYRSDIRDKKSLELNFREKFKALNKVNLTDNEFTQLLEQITSQNVFKASKLLRQTNSFEREDGTPLHYTLINIKDWCKNTFEVISQLRINTNNSFHRYDVILLINGIPLVQIELKNLQISPRRAMQQIIKYKNDYGNGYTNSLLCFMQLFIVSNKTNTWYFANNNTNHFSFDVDERFLPIYQYADKNNKKITHLDEFSDAFLSKCKLSEMISRYMVLVQSEKKLMMMRPYQIYAVEAIVECIEDNRGNGYIWHTTGSGKTLTSFKASTLLKNNNNIKKVLFVVDRKDLDRQTREEFNKFQENCVEENTNTYTLVERLLSSDYADKVIVTTIQKLGLALDSTNKNNYKERLKPLANERIVFIFDECHRSQFGKNHKSIKEFFPTSQLFGFTGTPIFKENATIPMIDGEEATLTTTKDIFEKELHNYTITHAIEDRNVLSFHIDYFQPNGSNTTKQEDSSTRKFISEEIIKRHNGSTANKKFNAILATSSINNAIEYYQHFKELDHDLNIACVFSPPAEGNTDISQLQEDLPTEREDNKLEPKAKKQALINIIQDYNILFSTNHSINNFDVYYQDIQTRIKDQKYPNSDLSQSKKLDIVIVVDMLLTGFDSKFLNTMYVDKNLKYHGLIQAFSRTNRVLNKVKPFGNILDFRSQQDAVDTAITRFSGKDISNAKEIWLVEPVSKTINNFAEGAKDIATFMTANGLGNKPEQISNLKGDEARAKFINIFKQMQRAKIQLDQRTDLTPEEKELIEQAMPQDTFRAFKSMYLETAKRLQEKRDKGEKVADVVQQLDFEFVLFASTLVDYDYIMSLVAKYIQEPEKHKMSKEQIINLFKSNANMMTEQEDMIAYINSLEMGVPLKEADIKQGYEIFKANKNTTKLDDMAKKHNLAVNSLSKFVDKIINRCIFDGEDLTDLFAPLELGWKVRGSKELALMQELSPLLRKMANGKKISGLEVYDE
jgi:type I restriction enzyme R subunit